MSGFSSLQGLSPSASLGGVSTAGKESPETRATLGPVSTLHLCMQ